jgi:hypothetical protein
MQAHTRIGRHQLLHSHRIEVRRPKAALHNAAPQKSVLHRAFQRPFTRSQYTVEYMRARAAFLLDFHKRSSHLCQEWFQFICIFAAFFTEYSSFVCLDHLKQSSVSTRSICRFLIAEPYFIVFVPPRTVGAHGHARARRRGVSRHFAKLAAERVAHRVPRLRVRLRLRLPLHVFESEM